LENNPIPISYSEILKFNNKVFLWSHSVK
jgi:hypothetical protein